jgi:phosphonate transport system substrate-binding protein
LSFGNGDPNSTSGFLVPSVFVFSERNVDPKECYKTVTNANHETNLMAVVNKQVDFATNNTENMAKIQKNFPEKFKELKVIWKSPLIPSDPIVWRKNLADGDKAKIKDFFMTYGNAPEEKTVLAGLQWGQFKDSNDDQLVPIRILELFKKRIAVETDTTISDTDKQAKLAEIDGKLGELKEKEKSLATN